MINTTSRPNCIHRQSFREHEFTLSHLRMRSKINGGFGARANTARFQRNCKVVATIVELFALSHLPSRAREAPNDLAEPQLSKQETNNAVLSQQHNIAHVSCVGSKSCMYIPLFLCMQSLYVLLYEIGQLSCLVKYVFVSPTHFLCNDHDNTRS